MRLTLRPTIVITGCQRSADQGTDVIIGGGGGLERPDFLLAEEPAGAAGVLDVKSKAKDGEEIVVVGKVGGRPEPFVKGRASFMIADMSLKSAKACETPIVILSGTPSS